MNKPQQPRILHIASGDLWAGAEVQLYTLARTLHDTLQIPVNVVLLNHGTLEQKLNDAGVTVTVLDESKLGTINIFLGISDIIRDTKPDIVHTHRTKENILGSIAAFINGRVPSIRTVHGAPEHGATMVDIPKRMILFLEWLCGRFLQTRIISVSEELAGILRKNYPSKKIETIENGVDVSLLQKFRNTTHSDAINATGNTFRIGYAGRLVSVKRVDMYLRTAAFMLEHYPDLKTEFHIFGDGPMQAELEDLCQSLGISGIVKFEGHRDDLHQRMSELDALMITSDHEGLPMILLEAMAMEIPVIAHAVGGIPKVLCNGSCGILVTRQDPACYTSSIRQLIDSPDAARRLSKLAFDQVASIYSAESNACSYAHTYAAITRPARQSPSNGR